MQESYVDRFYGNIFTSNRVTQKEKDRRKRGYDSMVVGRVQASGRLSKVEYTGNSLGGI